MFKESESASLYGNETSERRGERLCRERVGALLNSSRSNQSLADVLSHKCSPETSAADTLLAYLIRYEYENLMLLYKSVLAFNQNI